MSTVADKLNELKQREEIIKKMGGEENIIVLVNSGDGVCQPLRPV